MVQSVDTVETRTDTTKQEWIVEISIAEAAVRSVRFQVDGAAVQGNHIESMQANEPTSVLFSDLPPVLDHKVTLTQKAVSGSQGRYTITVTFKDSDNAALTADPTPAPTVADIDVDPKGAAVAINATTGAPLSLTTPLTVGTTNDGIYTVVYQLQYGVTSATLDLIDGYVASSTGVTIPPAVTAKQNPPTVTLTVSEHNATNRTFRVEVSTTPANDTKGMVGAAIAGSAIKAALSIKDGGTPANNVGVNLLNGDSSNESSRDNSYRAYLEYGAFDTLPLTVSIDPNDLATNTDAADVAPVIAGVGGAPTTPPVTGAPGAPTGLTATPNQTTKMIMLSWTEPASDGGSAITSYTINQTGAATATHNPTGTATSFTTPALTATGTYSFTVAAINANGTGTASTAASATIDADPIAGSITAAYDPATMTTTISSGSIGANDFVVIGEEDLPDLYAFLKAGTGGGSITLDDGDGVDDKNSRTVVISEVLWGYDLGMRAVDPLHKGYQFIELYNTTGADIDLMGWKLVFTARRVEVPIDIDQFHNRQGGGWDLTSANGQHGRIHNTTAENPINRIAGVQIISMYRNINYYIVEKTHDADAKKNRDAQLKDFPSGHASGSWLASKRWTINPWILDSRGLKHLDSYKQIPGSSVITPTSVPRSPFVINEIGNSTGGANDWIELRNKTDQIQSLKNYQLSVVTDDKKDTQLFHFHDKDYKVPGQGVVLIASTHPKNSALATGIDISLDNVTNTADPKKVHADQVKNQVLSGLNHLYVVRSFNIPDSGKTLLILRNNHETGKLGKPDNISDVVGTLGIKDNSHDFGTSLWPLKATSAPNGNVIDGTDDEDLRAGKVYQRNDAEGGIGEKDLATGVYTGVGYDRHAATSGQNNNGTPGYDNGAVKRDKSDWKMQVSISEIMLASHQKTDDTPRIPRAGRLPQWIEIYNNSMTEAVSLEKWSLEIRNADSDDLITRDLHGTLVLPKMIVQPNQTVLIVSSSGLHSPNFPSQRVINLFTNSDYRKILSLENRNDPILSQKGFYILLNDHKGNKVDEVGNLPATLRRGVEARGPANYTPVWELPEMNHADGPRTSLIRIYNDGMPADGLMKVVEMDSGMKGGETDVGWRRAADTKFNMVPGFTYYGNQNDIGSPGYRGGGPLPVSLSKFRPERLKETGEVVVRWITESELNNAGFNILRSDTRNGEYTKLNTQLIAGQGTTSERTTYEWKDTSAKPNVAYYYQIQDVSLDGRVTPLRVNRLKGHVNAAGKLTTTWGKLKALQ